MFIAGSALCCCPYAIPFLNPEQVKKSEGFVRAHICSHAGNITMQFFFKLLIVCSLVLVMLPGRMSGDDYTQGVEELVGEYVEGQQHRKAFRVSGTSVLCNSLLLTRKNNDV